jgi:DNA mismatch repair protein MutS
MDEIGRGTSTFDGLALASGIAAHLHDKNARLHLVRHPLLRADRVSGQTPCGRECARERGRIGSDIVFLHEIQAGPASRSYGIQVARLAGMPAAVVNHARHALAALEGQQADSREQVDLFAPPPPRADAGPSPAEAALAAIDPDTLSPREALDALYALKKKLS